MFRNYLRTTQHEAPAALSVARVLFGIYLVWKLVSLDLRFVDALPPLARRYLDLTPEPVLAYAPVEQAAAVLVVALFTVGYRTRLTGVVGAALVSHLGVSVWLFNRSGTTQAYFMSSLLMVLFALYADQDRVSIDEFRRSIISAPSDLVARFESTARGSFRADPLRVFLLVVAITYFGSGYSKIVHGPLLQWATATSLGRHIENSHTLFGYDPAVADLLLDVEPLLFVAAVGTLVLETGFLLSVLLDRGFSTFVLSLLGFHTVVTAVQGPVFLDHMVFLCLFVDWNAVLARVESTDRLDIVCDERCGAPLRMLAVLGWLDVRGTIAVHARADAPEEWIERVGPAGTVYVVVGGTVYDGYDAFRALFAHLGVLAPLAALLGLPVVRPFGETLYARFTAQGPQ